MDICSKKIIHHKLSTGFYKNPESLKKSVFNETSRILLFSRRDDSSAKPPLKTSMILRLIMSMLFKLLNLSEFNGVLSPSFGVFTLYFKNKIVTVSYKYLILVKNLVSCIHIFLKNF